MGEDHTQQSKQQQRHRLWHTNNCSDRSCNTYRSVCTIWYGVADPSRDTLVISACLRVGSGTMDAFQARRYDECFECVLEGAWRMQAHMLTRIVTKIPVVDLAS